MTPARTSTAVNVERSAQKWQASPESEFVAKNGRGVARHVGRTRCSRRRIYPDPDLKHAHTVQWLFKLCRENGFVYPGHYTGNNCIYDTHMST